MSPFPSVLLFTTLLTAQSASAQPAPASAGWQNGFFVQSADGANRLQLGLLGQVDGRFSLDDPAPFVDTFTIRKARPIFAARLAKYFDVRIMPDFGNGTTALFDAYMDVRFSPAFRLRAGKDKTPVGYELLVSDPVLLFPERSLASGLVPNRDIGFAALGDLAGGRVSYTAGVYNGVPDGANSTTEVDGNNAKDLAARVLVQPFRRAAGAATALSGLAFHVGGSTGTQAGTLPSFKTSVGQTYFSYASATAAGRRTRVTPAVIYYVRNVGAFGEYMRSTQRVAKNGVTRDVTNTGWDISGVVNVTGEPAVAAGGVTPKRPFDPAAGAWGALQIVARYSRLDVADEAVDAGFAAAAASRRADQFTIGANWYPVAFVKYYATFERTTFDGGAEGARPAENVILFRVQFAF